jgi:hypothetical protein
MAPVPSMTHPDTSTNTESRKRLVVDAFLA